MNADVTILLKAVQAGDDSASAELVSTVYGELRSMARGKMAREGAEFTLQPTALVHEAWMRLLDDAGRALFQNRAHFFGAAAEAMRRVLVDRARRRKAQKRGGDRRRTEMGVSEIASPASADEILAVHEALEKFARIDARKAEVVKLRYFTGLSFEETAALLEISVPTAHRDWAYARAWLQVEIAQGM